MLLSKAKCTKISGELLEGLRNAKTAAIQIAKEAFPEEILQLAGFTLDDLRGYLDDLPDLCRKYSIAQPSKLLTFILSLILGLK